MKKDRDVSTLVSDASRKAVERYELSKSILLLAYASAMNENDINEAETFIKFVDTLPTTEQPYLYLWVLELMISTEDPIVLKALSRINEYFNN